MVVVAPVLVFVYVSPVLGIALIPIEALTLWLADRTTRRRESPGSS
jgi:hypothetical protein